MNDIDAKPGEIGSASGGRRRAWLRRSILAGALVAVTALGLAACGGGGSSSTGASGGSSPGASRYGQALAYSRCMRAHGDPSYPDPQSVNGGIAISPANHNSPQVQSAEHACRSLAPPAPTAAQQAQMRAQQLRFARCMRAHGVPKFPDPPSTGGLSLGGTGVDKGSPQFQHAMQACRSDLGSGAPQQQAP